MKPINFPWLAHYDECTPIHLDYPKVPLHWFLAESTRKFGEKVCCIFGDLRLTYLELDRLTLRLAGILIRNGLQPGDRVAVILPNCPQFVLAFYAIARAGGVIVAINPAYKQTELAFQLNDSGARFAVVLDTVYDLLKSLQSETVVQNIIVTSLSDDLRCIKSSSEQHINSELSHDQLLLDCLSEEINYSNEPTIDLESPVIFQYSGGTTGIPKAAIGTHRNLVANTLQFKAWLGGLREGEEVVLAAIPLFHVYGMVIAMSLGIALGAALVMIPDPRDMTGILTAIEEYKATLFPGVPTMYQAIVKNPDVQSGRYELRSIKACISGSAPLLPEVKMQFENLTGGKLLEGYGLSEAPTATHCNPFYGENRTGSIGLPLPDVEAAVVDIDQGETRLPAGECGELVIRGPQVMPAYHNQPEETQLTLREGWLYTGDIARIDEEGYFYLVARKKEMIKIGGFQVWPREIEEIIASHPAVADCAVVGVPGDDRVEIVKAWIVLQENGTISAEQIRNWCSDKIARYKVPTEIEFLPKLPRSTVGKLLKRVLIQQYLEDRSIKTG